MRNPNKKSKLILQREAILGKNKSKHINSNNRPDKGLKGGSCNITSCQEPHSAFYFNKSTMAYYCRRCATEINWPGGRADCMRLFGTPLLCELDE